MVKGGDVGGFGGGSLEQPRQWLGAWWAGLSPWECRAAQSRQARPEEAHEPSWGTAKAGALTMLLRVGGVEGLGRLRLGPRSVGEAPGEG